MISLNAINFFDFKKIRKTIHYKYYVNLNLPYFTQIKRNKKSRPKNTLHISLKLSQQYVTL